MKRFLLVFFSLLLPLQMSWAAVMAYGQDGAWEAAVAAVETRSVHCANIDGDTDVGSYPAESSRSDPDVSAQHGDCSLCHLEQCGIVDGGIQPLVFAASLVHDFAPLLSIPSPFAAPPERPKWLLFA